LAKEELNISAKNLSDVMSQTWGMVQAFMVGFVVEYKSTKIEADNKEIIKASWFSRDELTYYPPSIRFAYYIIVIIYPVLL
jgi:NAD+ diphosphatase